MAIHGRRLGQLLVEVGLCPPNAKNIELQIPADGAVLMHYDVFVTDDEIGKLADVLARLLITPPPGDKD